MRFDVMSLQALYRVRVQDLLNEIQVSRICSQHSEVQRGSLDVLTDRRDELPEAWIGSKEDELPEVNATFSDGKDGLVIVDLVDKVLVKKILVRDECYERTHIAYTTSCELKQSGTETPEISSGSIGDLSWTVQKQFGGRVSDGEDRNHSFHPRRSFLSRRSLA